MIVVWVPSAQRWLGEEKERDRERERRVGAVRGGEGRGEEQGRKGRREGGEELSGNDAFVGK